MFGRISTIKFTILSVFFLALFIYNAFFLFSPYLGAFLLIFYLVVFGGKLGMAISPHRNFFVQWLAGSWTLVSIVMIIGAFFYYVFMFTQPVAVVMALLTPPFVWWLARRGPNKSYEEILEENAHSTPWFVWGASAGLIILLVVSLSLISQGATEEAIRSPWDRITPAVFISFGLVFALLAGLLMRGRERTISISLAIAVLFSFLSIALLVFPLGYGFDTFIHQATESHIAAHGTITPKPLYYIGQYAAVIFLHHGFALPINWADALLVPLLAALMLPIAWYVAAVHLLENKRNAIASMSFLFLIPLTSFIVTTPQGLANLWIVLTILMAVPRILAHKDWPIWPIAIGALATMIIHPISGIPIMLFLALVAADPKNPHQKYPLIARIISWITIVFGSVILPATFLINSAMSGNELNLDLGALAPARLLESLHLEIFLENRFSPILDFVYLFAFNQIFILVLMSIIAIILYRKTSSITLRFFFLMSLILLINYAVMNSAVEFTFLIDYERSNYSDRLIPIAVYFLIPFIILFAGKIFEQLRQKPVVLRTSVLLLLSGLMSGSLYLTYPRNDNYETSHGFNLSRADIDAVLEVEANAGSENYVVLANQTVSSAAIREMGFTRYYGDVFYYPIPTGGPLYRHFLSMNEHPNTDTVQSAMDLAGVDLLFYLVNDYWWEADRIIETAKTNADDWWSVGDGGAVYIFKYER